MREKPQNKHDQGKTKSVSEKLRLEEIVNRSPAVAFIWQAAEGWPVEFVSDNIRQFGYKPQDFYSGKMSYASIVHPDDLERVSSEVKSYTRKKVAEFTREYRIVTHDKQIRWVDDWMWVKQDNRGKVLSYQGIVLDITQRELAEEALRESEEKFRSIVENSLAGIFKVDDLFRFVYANAELCRILDYPIDELIGMNFQDGLSDESRGIVVDRYIRRQRGEQVPPRYELKIKRRKGELRDAEMIVTVVKDFAGKPSTMGQLIDITERKQAEEVIKASERRLSEALSVAKMGCWEYDVLNGLFTFNDQYYTLHKTTSELVGGYQMTAENFSRHFIFSEDAHYVKEVIAEAIATSDFNFQKQLEGRIVCTDGEVRWIVMWFRVEKDKDGRTIKLHGVNQDIHDRKLAEEKVQHHAARAEALASVATQINRQVDLDTTLTSVCEDTARVFNTQAAVILLVDPLSQTVNVVSGYGLPIELKNEVSAIPIYIFKEALTLYPDVPLVLQDFKSQIGIPGSDLLQKYDIRTIAFARIKWQTQVIGALVVLNLGNSRQFDEDDLSLLQSLADESAQAIMNDRFLKDASRRLERLEALRTIDNAIAASLDLRHTLSVFLDQLRHQLYVDAADILLFNPHSLTYDYAFGIGMRTDGLKNSSVYPDNDPIGTIVLNRQRVQIPDLQKGSDFARNQAFKMEGFVSYFGVPLIAKGQVRGVLELFHRTCKIFNKEWIDFLESLAGQAAISIDNAALFDDLQRSNLELTLAYDATIEGWSHALELRDEGTEGHTQRVTRLTLKLAKEMGIGNETLTHIRRGAMLHDIGKMGISDEVLHKPDKLNAEEMVAMKKHPQYAYEMLSTIRYLKSSLDIPYCHHEKWDGTGYPRGLSGEQIPLAARLFAIVDVWDAIISDRPYRAAWGKEKALKYIKDQSGKYFDPDIVKSFLKIIKSEPSD
ncbi:MAG: HD domain-containing phosphohydrolase [Anaerolineaceae bacterium]